MIGGSNNKRNMHIILNSFGSSISKENGLFVIKNQQGKQFLNPEEVKSISISKGASITSDAVLHAIHHEIDILFIDGVGMPKGRIWSSQYGSISTIRKNQVDFVYSQNAVFWIKKVLIEKLDNQIAILLTLPTNLHLLDRKIQAAVNTIEDHKSKIAKIEGDIVSDIAASLRGWEGAASRKYFSIVSASLPFKYQFESRSHHPALDIFNALLNYGYGMLYSKIEGCLIRAGVDPYVGIMHRDDYNRPVLVYDFIEKFRVWIDYVVIKLCVEDAFIDECFENTNGSVLLVGLGKRILIQSINDYFAEIIPIENKERSRSTHIQEEAYSFARMLKNFSI